MLSALEKTQGKAQFCLLKSLFGVNVEPGISAELHF